jgi:hypothetical protein
MRGNWAPAGRSPEVVLLAEVIADLHRHGDAFGIAGPGERGLPGAGAESPGAPGQKLTER